MTPERAFVEVDGRQIHYRRWGKGPVVLAVHGSPQSSRAVALQAEALAARGLCVIAPDTPGNGLSTPLAKVEPTTSDYADALIAFADALRLGRFGLYGFHTGASTACAVAAKQPQRTAAVAFDGLPCWTEEERADYLAHYLTPFAPTWDGSHMTWLWSRLEEQTVFFPWHDPRPANRMDYDVSPLAALHLNAIDMLDAGDDYRAPYRSAFTFRAEDWIDAVSSPHLIACVADDPLAAHLRRAPLDRPTAAIFADKAAIVDGCADVLAAHPGDPAPAVTANASGRGFTRVSDRALAWQGSLSGSGRPLVLLHGAGDSGDVFAPALAAIAARRPVVALDLPGHGASGDDWPQAPDTVEALADIVAEACRTLGLDAPTVVGQGLGGQIAARMLDAGQAHAAATLGVAAHTADERAALIARGAPSLTPEWDGAHLVRAFRIARWERLFSPWFERDRVHAIAQGALEPASVHARAVRLLKAHERWTSAVLAQSRFDLAKAMRDHPSFEVFAVENDPLSTPDRLGRLGRPSRRLEAAPETWAAPLSALHL